MIWSKTPLASGWIVLQHVWHAAPASTHCGSVITTSEPASEDAESCAASLAVASTPASEDELDPHANKKEAQSRRHNRILES
jgi:hypothetical protein